MTVAQLDNFFGPAVEHVIQLRDACRRAVQHRDLCAEEAAALAKDQWHNLAEPARRGAAIRTTGAGLDRARDRLAVAEAEAERLQDELTQAAKACPTLFPERTES
jgi:hypothetical protein